MQINKKYLIVALILISIFPFVWLLTDYKHLGGFIYSFGNVAGLIGAVLFFWQMILGIRGVLGKVTTDYSWSIKLHTLIGIYGTFFVLLHPIIEMFSYLENWLFIFTPRIESEHEIFITLGRFAFLLFLLIWITSAVLREKIKFRPWLYIHYLTYPMMLLVLFHANQVGSYIAKYPFIQMYWIVLMFGFWLMVIYKTLQVVNIGKKKYKATKVEALSAGNFLYTFSPMNKRLIPRPGQFFYIKNRYFGESHPFTIMEYKEASGELVFGVKAIGKYTKQLSEIKIGSIVYLDGPYGEFTKQAQNHNPKVFIAGGIGITPFVEVVERFSDNNTFMLYSNQKLENAIRRDLFKNKLGDRYYDFISRESKKGKNIINSRIGKNNLPKDIEAQILKNTNFFICGNGEFNKSMKKMLIELGVKKNRIFYEDFGF